MDTPGLRSSLTARRLVMATHNPGKVVELADLLTPLGIAVVSAGELGLPEPEETELTFAGNALLKARAAATGAGLPALADDSGLSVEALDGAPGIYSARWAGPGKDFGVAMARVEQALIAAGDKGAARAKFVCALALVLPEGGEHVFEGEVHGTLVFPPRGDRGFGYDPIFLADGFDRTFGEIDPALKHAVSHRAAAFAKFLAAL
jgi:XTP/dITP diphosphohydrolase